MPALWDRAGVSIRRRRKSRFSESALQHPARIPMLETECRDRNHSEDNHGVFDQKIRHHQFDPFCIYLASGGLVSGHLAFLQ